MAQGRFGSNKMPCNFGSGGGGAGMAAFHYLGQRCQEIKTHQCLTQGVHGDFVHDNPTV